MQGIVFAAAVAALVGLIAAILLAVAAKYMSVPVDEKFPSIRKCLPGANCGACGYAGCDGYAGALADGTEEKTNKCIPGGKTTADELSRLFGKEAEPITERVAFVRCSGSNEATGKKAEKLGYKTCKAAGLSFGGDGLCRFGCLRYGDCADACPSDAIRIINGVAKINQNVCTGCGVCVNTCPRKLIMLIEKKELPKVACMNEDKGAVTRKICTAGCIGCGLCMRNCPAEAIQVKNALASIDETKCIGCNTCKSVCPSNCIH